MIPAGPLPLRNPRHAEFNPENHLATGSAHAGLGTPYAADAWTADDLVHQRLVRSVADAFQESPAAAVQASGPGQATPNIRGFSGPRTALLMDGIRLDNSATGEGPGLLWNSLDAFDVSRLETVRSPSSVRYGSGAVGAVSEATLRSAADDWRPGLRRPVFAHLATRVSAAENSHQEHGELGYAKDAWQFLFGAGFKRFGDIQSPGSPGLQTGTEYEQHDLMVKGSYRITGSDRILFAFNHNELVNAPNTNQTGAGKPWKGSTTGTDIYNRANLFRDLLYARYIAEDQTNFLERLIVTLSVNRVRFETDRKDATFRHINTGVTVTTPGFVAEFIGRPILLGAAGRGRITAGIDCSTDRVDSFLRDYNAAGAINEIGLQGPVADDAVYNRLAVFVQYEQWIREHFSVMGGLRFSNASANLSRLDTDARSGAGFQTAGSLHDSWQNLSFDVRVLHRISEFDSVYVGVSHSFRTPSLVDLSTLQDFGAMGRETPNTGTLPEQFFTFEIGNRLATPHVSGQAALFYTHMADLLVTAAHGGGVFQRDNAGYGDVYGLELEGVWDVHGTLQQAALRGISVFGNFTWQQGFAQQFSPLDGVHHRQWLTGAPPPMLLLGARWDVPGQDCFGELVTRWADVQDRLSTADRMNTGAIPPGGTPSYLLVTLRGGGKKNIRGVPMQASLALENIFNRNYRVHGSGTNEPGFNLVATIEADL